MIIKIQNPHCTSGNRLTYTLVDDVSDITHFSSDPVVYNDFESLDKFLRTPYNEDLLDEWADHTLVGFDEIEDMKQRNALEKGEVEYRVNWIIFNRKNTNGHPIYYAFDTVCYICNDDGKTLEKCYAGGFMSIEQKKEKTLHSIMKEIIA